MSPELVCWNLSPAMTLFHPNPVAVFHAVLVPVTAAEPPVPVAVPALYDALVWMYARRSAHHQFCWTWMSWFARLTNRFMMSSGRVPDVFSRTRWMASV